MLSEGDALTIRGRSFHRDGPAFAEGPIASLSLCPGNLKQVAISRGETTAKCVGVQQLTDNRRETCRVKLDRCAARS